MKSSIIALLLFTGSAFGQKNLISVNYGYFLSPKWNEAIALYNFARPFFKNPQPALHHKVQLGFKRVSTDGENWQFGPKAQVSYIGSQARNNNSTVTLKAWSLDLGISLRKHVGLGGAIIELSPTLGFSELVRTTTDVENPDESGALYSPGGCISAEGSFIKPFTLGKLNLEWATGICFTPYQWNNKPWRILSESRTGKLTNFSYAANIFSGIVFTWGKSEITP